MDNPVRDANGAPKKNLTWFLIGGALLFAFVAGYFVSTSLGGGNAEQAVATDAPTDALAFEDPASASAADQASTDTTVSEPASTSVPNTVDEQPAPAEVPEPDEDLPQGAFTVSDSGEADTLPVDGSSPASEPSGSEPAAPAPSTPSTTAPSTSPEPNSPATTQAATTTNSGTNNPRPNNPTPTTTAPATPASTAAPATAAPTTTAAPPPTTAAARTSGGFYVDPYNSAAQWARNNASDPRAATISSQIGSQAIARWFGDWNGNVRSDVNQYVTEAHAAGGIPVLVVYNIPDRDCGQHSSGGAANAGAYAQWINEVTAGLGGRQATIVLEPDSLALNDCAGPERDGSISSAVTTIKSSCGECQVYLDAGHSNWVGAGEMANRLRNAGVLNADGFFTNVSNYQTTSAEAAFGQQVLNALGNPAGLAQVIDTSRNGNGANGEWCDPAGRAIGEAPTPNTGRSTVDAYIWIKVPGEADGCLAGAGQFVPQRAFDLARG